jgi:hypothetical protein
MKTVLKKALFLFVLAGIAIAQQTSTETRNGQPSSTTEVRNGEVVYVSGNALVVKMEDGSVRDFTVPESAKFTVDGKEMTVHDLKPGMKLTQTITTTTTPKMVTTVRTITGRVWHVSPPKSVILRLPTGENQKYTVPEGTKFNINGQERTIFDLRRGMNVSATVTTEEPTTEVTRTSSVTGQMPPPPPTPPATGPILIVQTVVPPAPAAAPSAPEQKPKSLPQTASWLPLLALIGVLLLLTGNWMRHRIRY